MGEENDLTVEITKEQTEIEKKQAKRQKMCNAILELETKNLNKTDKISDAAMARKIADIIEGAM